MSSRGRRVWPSLLALALAAVLIAACGRKTLPVPPQEAIPEPITDLQFVQDESRINLTWTYPQRTTVGTDLPGLESFLVLRAVVAEADYCPGCPVSFSSALEVEADKAIIDPKQRLARYTETILRPGHRYLYKVQSKAGWRLISDDSNTVSFFWDSPALAPEEVTAETGDGRITLGWQPVAKLVNGEAIGPALLYQVYRGQSPEALRPVGEAVAATTYTDSGLVNDQPYHYQVRAVREKNGTRLAGLASHAVSVAPKDLTPPAPPRQLTGVLVAGGVKLLWERSTEKDLAGYRLYRRLPAATTLTLIGEVDRATMTFVDQLTQAPEGCYWAVTAFDKATPANESAYSKELFHESF